MDVEHISGLRNSYSMSSFIVKVRTGCVGTQIAKQ